MDFWGELKAELAAKHPAKPTKPCKTVGSTQRLVSNLKTKSKHRNKSTFPRKTLSSLQASKPVGEYDQKSMKNTLPTHVWHLKHSMFGVMRELKVPICSKSDEMRNYPSLRARIQEKGAMALDTSFHVNLEVYVESEDVESQLLGILPGVNLRIYKSGRRLYQGHLGNIAPVAALWLGSKSLLINVHCLAVKNLPVWLMGISRPTNVGSIDIIGPEAISRLARSIEPSQQNQVKIWPKFAEVLPCLIPHGTVLEFSASESPRLDPAVSRVIDRRNLSRQLGRMKPTSSTVEQDPRLTRILFFSSEHIRILVAYNKVLPLWNSLGAQGANRIILGTLREWLRINFEYAKPCFPVDYPETDAGAHFWETSITDSFGKSYAFSYSLPVKRVLIKTNGPVPYTGTQLLDIKTRERIGIITTGRFNKTGAMQHGIGVIREDYNANTCIFQYYGGTNEFLVNIEQLS